MLISALTAKSFYAVMRKNVVVGRKLIGLIQFNIKAKLSGGSSDYKKQLQDLNKGRSKFKEEMYD